VSLYAFSILINSFFYYLKKKMNLFFLLMLSLHLSREEEGEETWQWKQRKKPERTDGVCLLMF